MDIGNVLKLVRTRKNLTQQEMADTLGISQNYLSLIESNKKKPSIDLITEFAKVLKISTEALLFASSEIPKELDDEDSLRYQKLQNNILTLLLFKKDGEMLSGA